MSAATKLLVPGSPAAHGRAFIVDPITDGPISQDEPDRITVHVNGIVVDVIANDDGSVYVEAYAYETRRLQAIVQHSQIDRYQTRTPNLRLSLADRPDAY